MVGDYLNYPENRMRCAGVCYCSGACMGYDWNIPPKSFTWTYPIAGVVDSISVVIDGIEYEPIPFDELPKELT